MSYFAELDGPDETDLRCEDEAREDRAERARAEGRRGVPGFPPAGRGREWSAIPRAVLAAVRDIMARDIRQDYEESIERDKYDPAAIRVLLLGGAGAVLRAAEASALIRSTDAAAAIELVHQAIECAAAGKPLPEGWGK